MKIPKKSPKSIKKLFKNVKKIFTNPKKFQTSDKLEFFARKRAIIFVFPIEEISC